MTLPLLEGIACEAIEGATSAMVTFPLFKFVVDEPGGEDTTVAIVDCTGTPD